MPNAANNSAVMNGFGPLWDAGTRLHRLNSIVSAVHCVLLHSKDDEVADIRNALGNLSVELGEIHEIIHNIAVSGFLGKEKRA